MTTPCHRHRRGVWLHEWSVWFRRHRPFWLQRGHSGRRGLANLIPLQSNVLGSSPLNFSDPQSMTNVRRFYRAQFLP